MDASCTASSASERSPTDRTRVASSLAPSNRISSDSVSAAAMGAWPLAAELEDRPHLDGAVPGPRDLSGDTDRGVEVGGLEQVEPGQRLLGLRVRAVGGEDIAAAG